MTQPWRVALLALYLIRLSFTTSLWEALCVRQYYYVDLGCNLCMSEFLLHLCGLQPLTLDINKTLFNIRPLLAGFFLFTGSVSVNPLKVDGEQIPLLLRSDTRCELQQVVPHLRA